MFKMGCMARKILAPGSSSNADLPAGGGLAETGGSKKNKNKDKTQAIKSPVPKSADELGDFSKLEDDPRLPLNKRQIFKITKSWKAIARTMSKTGTAMFLNLFEQNKELFYLFDRFQHLKGQELHESMELREHAATVMSTLDQSINSLSDYDNFVTYLHSIGQLHRKVPGFQRDYFWKIEQPFMKAVKQTLDERCNESIEEIYKIAIKLIIETIADGYGIDAPTTSSAKPGNSSSGSGDTGNSGTRPSAAGGDSSAGAAGGTLAKPATFDESKPKDNNNNKIGSQNVKTNQMSFQLQESSQASSTTFSIFGRPEGERTGGGHFANKLERVSTCKDGSLGGGAEEEEGRGETCKHCPRARQRHRQQQQQEIEKREKLAKDNGGEILLAGLLLEKLLLFLASSSASSRKTSGPLELGGSWASQSRGNASSPSTKHIAAPDKDDCRRPTSGGNGKLLAKTLESLFALQHGQAAGEHLSTRVQLELEAQRRQKTISLAL